jgi:hypothetical protein
MSYFYQKSGATTCCRKKTKRARRTGARGVTNDRRDERCASNPCWSLGPRSRSPRSRL